MLVFAQATDLSFDSGLSKAAQPDSTGRALVNPHILAIAKACTGAGVFPRPKRCLIQRSSVPPTSAAPSSGPVSESLALGARKRYRGCPQLAFRVSLAADRARCRRSSRRRMLSEQVCTHGAVPLRVCDSIPSIWRSTPHKLVSDGYLGRKEGTAIRCVCSSERPEQSILLSYAPLYAYAHTSTRPRATSRVSRTAWSRPLLTPISEEERERARARHSGDLPLVCVERHRGAGRGRRGLGRGVACGLGARARRVPGGRRRGARGRRGGRAGDPRGRGGVSRGLDARRGGVRQRCRGACAGVGRDRARRVRDAGQVVGFFYVSIPIGFSRRGKKRDSRVRRG